MQLFARHSAKQSARIIRVLKIYIHSIYRRHVFWRGKLLGRCSCDFSVILFVGYAKLSLPHLAISFPICNRVDHRREKITVSQDSARVSETILVLDNLKSRHFRWRHVRNGGCWCINGFVHSSRVRVYLAFCSVRSGSLSNRVQSREVGLPRDSSLVEDKSLEKLE